MASFFDNPLMVAGAVLAVLFFLPRLLPKVDKTFSELGRERLSNVIQFLETNNVNRVYLPANGNEPPKILKGFRAGWANLNLMLDFSKQKIIMEIDRDALSDLGRGVWAIKEGAIIVSETNNVFHVSIPKTREWIDRDGTTHTVDISPISNYRLNMNSELEFKKFDLTFNKLAKISEAEAGAHMEIARMQNEEKRRKGVLDS